MLSEAAMDVFAGVGILVVFAATALIIYALIEDWWYRRKPAPPYDWSLDSEFHREWVIR